MNVATDSTFSGYRAPARRGQRGAVLGVCALALLGVVLGVATYAGQEATAIALLIASMLAVGVVARPQVGIMVLVMNYLFASYPTVIRGGGLLTINNVLGVILAVILVAELSQRPDVWFLHTLQVRMFAVIAVVLLVSTIASYATFPGLRVTFGGRRNLDQTGPLTRDFVTRFAFLLLGVHFLTTKRHIKMVIAMMLLCLILVVPSALYGWWTGAAQRAAASFSIGTNSNRLAFLCLMQAAFWWYLGQSQRSAGVRLISYGLIGALVLTVLLTASRSGFLGLCFLFFLLMRGGGSVGRGSVMGGRLKLLMFALLAVGMMMTVVPQESLDRIKNINPFVKGHGTTGTHSTERRVETVGLAWRVFLEYPVLGIGIGNFREVARQVYNDPFYRPPHNSYLWALSEGGIFCFIGFMLLFLLTVRDIRWVQRSPATPADLLWIAAALEASFYLFFFYCFFADMFMSPIAYILIIVTIVLKRYVSVRRVVLA